MHKVLLKAGVSAFALAISAGLGGAYAISPISEASLLVPVVDQETGSVRKNLRPEIYGSGSGKSTPKGSVQAGYDDDDEDDDDDEGPDDDDDEDDNSDLDVDELLDIVGQ
jgi:hypothetical protein